MPNGDAQGAPKVSSLKNAVQPPDAAPSRQAVPAVVPYRRWQSACEGVIGALLGGQRLVLVTGPAGTGKSQLLDQTAKVLRAAGWETVLRQADTSLPPGQTLRSVLMIDEADRLGPEELRRLLASAKVPMVLAGLESLALIVTGLTPVSLPLLSREEARDYIAQWLALTGRSPAHLETAAMRRLVELSGGVPRLISTLLAAAAWLAASSGESVMRQVHIEESAALRGSLSPHESDPAPLAASEPGPTPRRHVISVLPLALGVLLLGAGAFLAGRYFPDELRGVAAGAGRTIAWWQVALQDKLEGGLQHRASQTAAANRPPSPSPAVPEPAPPQVASTSVPTPRAEPPAPPAATVFIKPPAPSPAPAAPALATPLEPAPSIPASAAPAAPPPPAPAPQENKALALTPQTIEVLLRRGHEMLALGDVSAARLLFGRAADAGNGDAMLELGQTYDPNVIAQSKLMLAPNRAEAQRWYRKALAAGSKDAETMLERLGS